MLRKPLLPQYHECKSIREVYTELANRCGFGDKFPWKSDEEVVALELESSGIDFQTLLDAPEGIHYQPKDYALDPRSFATPTRKIEIYSEAFEQAGWDPCPLTGSLTKARKGCAGPSLGRNTP